MATTPGETAIKKLTSILYAIIDPIEPERYTDYSVSLLIAQYTCN